MPSLRKTYRMYSQAGTQHKVKRRSTCSHLPLVVKAGPLFRIRAQKANKVGVEVTATRGAISDNFPILLVSYE